MEAKEGVNLYRRRRRYGARDKEELIKSIQKLHNEGYSQVDIAKRVGIARGTILRWNKELHFFEPRTPGEAGKLKNKIYNYDENYFASIDTLNKAYILGFITGDGTIFDRKKSKRLVITLAEQDKQILCDIGKEMNVAELIKFRRRSTSNEQNKYSLVINSTKMCDDLITLGVTPKKTGNEKWIDFNDERLQWTYLRGLFDADGHIRVFMSNGKTRARFGLTGNEKMLLNVLSFLKSNVFAKKVNSLYKKQGCFDVQLGSIKELKQIYGKLYQYGDMKLNRKYQKFSSLMI